MAVLLLMHGDDRIYRRIREAVRREEVAGVKHRLVTVDSLRRLAEEVEIHQCLCVGIVELNDNPLRALQNLTERFPCLPLVAYAGASLASDVLRRVVALGVRYVLQTDVDDDANQIAESITRALLELPSARLTQRVSSELGDDAARVVARAFEVASGSRTIATLSRARSTGRRSLERDMKGSQLAPPARLVRHCRILLASVLLADPRRSFSSVSAALGYSGERTISRQLQALGVRRRDLTCPGGVDRVIELVLEEIIRPSSNGQNGNGRHH